MIGTTPTKWVWVLAAVLVCGAVLAGVGRQEQLVGVEFVAVDIFIDAGDSAIGSYQIEFDGSRGGQSVTLVGVEGGESVYASAPYYDPAALSDNRVIIAGLSTAEKLPAGRVRVARLHLQQADAGKTEYRVFLMAAGDESGARIEAQVSVEPTEGGAP